MICPICSFKTSIVIDSRPEDDCTHRRRRCCNCNYTWSTCEVDEDYIKSLQKRVKWEDTKRKR